MNILVQYFERTIRGMESCFAQNKIVVLLLAILLLLWLGDTKTVNAKANRMLVYSVVLTCLLLCPFTAVIAVIYQGAFYDYEWVWSMVPVIGGIAYGCVWLCEEKIQNLGVKKWCWYIVFLVLLFLAGNQGKIKTVSEQEIQMRTEAEQVVSILHAQAGQEKIMLWAPKDIMQETRRLTGEILLVYGKDMWDPKAGAYDYEAYSPEYVRAYEWMEKVTILSLESTEESEEALYESYNVKEHFDEVFQTMLAAGVNGIILPVSTSENLEEEIMQKLDMPEMSVEKFYLEQFVVYLIR